MSLFVNDLAYMDSVSFGGSAHRLENDHVRMLCDHVENATIVDEDGEEDKERYGWNTVLK